MANEEAWLEAGPDKIDVSLLAPAFFLPSNQASIAQVLESFRDRVGQSTDSLPSSALSLYLLQPLPSVPQLRPRDKIAILINSSPLSLDYISHLIEQNQSLAVQLQKREEAILSLAPLQRHLYTSASESSLIGSQSATSPVGSRINITTDLANSDKRVQQALRGLEGSENEDHEAYRKTPRSPGGAGAQLVSKEKSLAAQKTSPEKPTEKPAEKSPERASEKTPEKASEKPAEKDTSVTVMPHSSSKVSVVSGIVKHKTGSNRRSSMSITTGTGENNLHHHHHTHTGSKARASRQFDPKQVDFSRKTGSVRESRDKDRLTIPDPRENINKTTRERASSRTQNLKREGSGSAESASSEQQKGGEDYFHKYRKYKKLYKREVKARREIDGKPVHTRSGLSIPSPMPSSSSISSSVSSGNVATKLQLPLLPLNETNNNNDHQ